MSQQSNHNGPFHTFSDFYPFYLREHSHPVNRALHVLGSSLSLLVLLFGAFTGRYYLILVAFIMGYAFAWVGHFFIEKNKPATFKYPFYSFAADWVMWFEVLTGKKSLNASGDRQRI